MGDGQNQEEDTGAGKGQATQLCSPRCFRMDSVKHMSQTTKSPCTETSGQVPDLQILEITHSHDNIQAVILTLSAPRF